MSQLTLDENSAKYQIRAYRPGYIQINESTFCTNLIVAPNTLIENWPPGQLAELKAEHFEPILNLHPAILLLGTGSVLEFPPIELYGHLINQGIGVEIMSTSAAAHTYNVLTAEDRNVVAALIIK